MSAWITGVKPPTVTAPPTQAPATTGPQPVVGNQTVNGKTVVWTKSAAPQGAAPQGETTANALRQRLGHDTSFQATDVIFKGLGLKHFGTVSDQEEQKADLLALNFISARKLAGNQGLSDSAVALKVVLTDRLGGDKAAAAAAAGIVNALGDKKNEFVKDNLGNKTTTKQQISDADASRLIEIADLYKKDTPCQMSAAFGKSYPTIFAGMHYGIGKAGPEYASTIAKLSHDELCALHCYTASTHCDAINMSLRDPINYPLDGKYQLAMNLANQALDKMPNFVGVCYRGALLPQKVDATLKNGGTYQDQAFLSSAAEKECAFAGTHQFTIFSQTGRDISFVSMAPHEKEVIFRNDTKFDIMNVKGKAQYDANAQPGTKPINSGNDKATGRGECCVIMKESVIRTDNW